jgi:acetyl-CoA synthetase
VAEIKNPTSGSSAAPADEAHIAVHWKEEEYFYPPKKFAEQAYLKDPKAVERFGEKNFPKCFEEYADMLTWSHRWTTVLDTNNPPFWKWFVGGKLNASYNCVDRHLEKYKDKAAIISVPEPENEEPIVITYQ